MERPACFVEGINRPTRDAPLDLGAVTLADLSTEDLRAFIARVRDLAKDVLPDIPLEPQVGPRQPSCLRASSSTRHPPHFECALQTHPVAERELASMREKGARAQKHMRQQASIVGHMENAGLLGSDRTFVEFGAGKGQLLYFVRLCNGEDHAASRCSSCADASFCRKAGGSPGRAASSGSRNKQKPECGQEGGASVG